MPDTAFIHGCSIRPVRLDDAAALAAAYDRNREHLAPWEPPRPESFFTEAGQREAVAKQLEQVELGLHLSWVVERDGDVVGRINLNNIVRGALWGGALGYWVDHRNLRQGLARAMVGHAVAASRELGLHRLEASTLTHNEASQRVLRGLGFEHYGTAPRFLFIAGSWQDHHLYQLLLHDDPPPTSR